MTDLSGRILTGLGTIEDRGRGGGRGRFDESY